MQPRYHIEYRLCYLFTFPSERYFYAVFDETFLGIYPDFVQKVNALLREDARFPVPTTRVLRTELRNSAIWDKEKFEDLVREIQ